MTEKDAVWFAENYEKIQKDPDRSKILSIHALFAFDDGEAYTEQEYRKATAILEKEMETQGDTPDGFIAKAIQWCKTRSGSCTTTK